MDTRKISLKYLTATTVKPPKKKCRNGFIMPQTAVYRSLRNVLTLCKIGSPVYWILFHHLRQTRIIRTRPKRRIFICRLYKAKALSHPPHKNPHENHARFGSQIFWGVDFLQSEAQNAVNPNGLTSILTRQCEKSTLKKRVWIILVCLVLQDSNLPRFRSPPFRLRLCVHFCKALALLQISRFAE